MKKVFGIVKNVLVWTVVAIAVAMMVFTVFSVNTFNRNDRQIFGYKMYIVNTDSMAATDFDAGALIFAKVVHPSTLKEGDIITFLSQDTDSFGETITHKIRSLTTDAEGNPGFVTYGTTTNNDDRTVVTYPYVMGKYVGHIPGIGTFFNFLKTTPGYFLCIFTPFMLIILYEGGRFLALFRKYRGEQMAEMNAEREKIEQERAANAEMLRELQALKAQLENSKKADEAPAEVSAELPKDEAPAEVPAELPKDEAPAEVPAELPKDEAPAEVPAELPKDEAPAESEETTQTEA